jgi:hypothetical protein
MTCGSGMPGSHNDINVLDRSSIFGQLQNGDAPQVNFKVNNNEYSLGYYLADGIYPDYSTLIKTIQEPVGRKNKVSCTVQCVCLELKFY